MSSFGLVRSAAPLRFGVVEMRSDEGGSIDRCLSLPACGFAAFSHQNFPDLLACSLDVVEQLR